MAVVPAASRVLEPKAGPGALHVSTGAGNHAGADFGVRTGTGTGTGTGLGLTTLGGRFCGATTSGVFGSTGTTAGDSIIRVVKAVVFSSLLMSNWSLADIIIAKCAIKTIANRATKGASQCLV